jgi:hypothetical protein
LERIGVAGENHLSAALRGFSAYGQAKQNAGQHQQS